jgi:methyl-accepting chemotaxis protein
MASNEQAQGITQVNEGLGQIDQVTQQNTANAEETAAAAEELSTQAQQLRAMLGRFRLKHLSSHGRGPIAASQQQRRLGGSRPRQEEKPKEARGDRENPEAGARMIALDDREFGRY